MLPNLSDYMQTFQNPQLFLADRELVGCSCPKDQQGQPKVQSGGFALTFRLESPTKKWAVRCFHREVADRAKRYTAISTKLNEPQMRQSGYFVNFDYQPQGVMVKGQRCPIVKMSWAQGVTLGAFLEANYNKSMSLQNLQESLRKLYKFLSSHHIAHGDIQPGNLMVSNDGRMVQLIDYDGMFVPGMESLKAAETGVPNFQHPERQGKSPWNDKLDRFPFIILDIALTVLQKNPSYWTQTNSSDEKVLFETTDYQAPYASPIFNQLKADPEFSAKISILQQICYSDFDSIPPADEYLQFKPSATLPQKDATQPETVTVSYQGNYKVLGATDVSAIAQNVGNVVEIIGYIIGTKDGYTRGSGRRGNRPYTFINFQVWHPRTTTFRLVLWSEVLDQFVTLGITSISGRFAGQYVSIVGMIHKFTNQFGTTYQLVPDKASKLHVIDKTEAEFRLGKIKKTLNQRFGGTAAAPAVPAAVGSNVDRLTSVLGGKARGQSPTGAKAPPRPNPGPIYTRKPVPGTLPPSSPVPQTNTGRLNTLKNDWDGTGSTSNPLHPTPPMQSPTPTTPSYTPPVKSGGGSKRNLIIIIVGIIAIIVAIIFYNAKRSKISDRSYRPYKDQSYRPYNYPKSRPYQSRQPYSSPPKKYKYGY